MRRLRILLTLVLLAAHVVGEDPRPVADALRALAIAFGCPRPIVSMATPIPSAPQLIEVEVTCAAPAAPTPKED